MARARGIQTVGGRAEALPFQDGQFDLVLLVTTLCFLADPETAFQETYRVLQPRGVILVGTFDPDSPPGAAFLEGNKESPFFQAARYYGMEAVIWLLRQAGFRGFAYRQTLRQGIPLNDREEAVGEGYGLGLFVVIKAGKP